MEFYIRPSTTKILRQMETNGLVIDTLAPAPPPAARQDRKEVGHHQWFQHALILLLILAALRQFQKPQRT